MAVTAGILNGTDLLVYDNTHPIAHCTSCSISLSMDMRDCSTKASAGWKAILPGQRSWSIEVTGLTALDSTYNYAYLMALITAKTRVLVKFRTANTDDFYYYGYAYLATCNVDAPNQGNVTYSASFTGDGALSLQAGGTIVPPIPDYDTAFDITGTVPIITVSGSSPVTGTLLAIADMTEAAITIKNNSSETVTIVSTEALKIDDFDSVDVAPDDYITIYPNVTKFEASGTFTETTPP